MSRHKHNFLPRAVRCPKGPQNLHKSVRLPYGTLIFHVFFSVHCLIVMFSGFCIALLSLGEDVADISLLFLRSMVCVLSTMVCFVFLFVSLIGYDL